MGREMIQALTAQRLRIRGIISVPLNGARQRCKSAGFVGAIMSEGKVTQTARWLREPESDFCVTVTDSIAFDVGGAVFGVQHF